MKCRLPRTKKIQVTPETVTLALTGTFHSSYAYVTVSGTKYTSTQVLTLEPGTEMTVFCSATGSSYRSRAYITLNGATVQSGSGSYTFSLSASTQIAMALESADSGSSTSVVGVVAAITTS